MFQKALKEDFERQSIKKAPRARKRRGPSPEASKEAGSKYRITKKSKPEPAMDKQALSGGFFSSRDSHKLEPGQCQDSDKLPFAQHSPNEPQDRPSRYAADKDNFRVRFQSARSPG
jgi:hypothetical protein